MVGRVFIRFTASPITEATTATAAVQLPWPAGEIDGQYIRDLMDDFFDANERDNEGGLYGYNDTVALMTRFVVYLIEKDAEDFATSPLRTDGARIDSVTALGEAVTGGAVYTVVCPRFAPQRLRPTIYTDEMLFSGEEKALAMHMVVPLDESLAAQRLNEKPEQDEV